MFGQRRQPVCSDLATNGSIVFLTKNQRDNMIAVGVEEPNHKSWDILNWIRQAALPLNPRSAFGRADYVAESYGCVI